MQAVILAAGNSSRLFPFGGELHKGAISLMGLSLVQRTVQALVSLGVSEIIIVVSPGNGIKEALGNTSDASVRFVTHEGAKGMGEAVLEAEKYLSGDFYLVHAHHFECEEFLASLLRLRDLEGAAGAIVVREEKNPEAFGIVSLSGTQIVEVIEKPEKHIGTHRIVGMYLLPHAFLETLRNAKKGHYSFESALNDFVQMQKVLGFVTEKETITLKYPWQILGVGDYLLKNSKQSIDPSANISTTATIEGEVVIGKGVKIEDNVVIKGPCFVGDGAYIGTNAILRNGVMIERGVVVGANMEVKHSILMDETTTHSGYIGDSVIGKQCKIAAEFCSGNVRIDRKRVNVNVKDKQVDSGHTSLGVFIGDSTKVGIRVSTMPGVLIGRRCVIGPSTTVFNNLTDEMTYYAKITEVIQKEKKGKSLTVPKRKIVLFDIDYTMLDTDKLKISELKLFELFEDVAEALSSIGAYATLGIFSEGDVAFQSEKLLKTAIHEHFAPEHMHIVSRKSESIAEVLDRYMEDTLFFVDDRLEILEAAKHHMPAIVTIWIKRGPFALAAKESGSFSPDSTIEDLRMVLPIVAGV
jgi:bifunctional UDP-N-acetylglucosamine pyrophosphorylase/glucosamine-1-phosphate N-acetyltransferase